MIPFSINAALSPQNLLRWVELFLAIVLAVALAELVWSLFPAPANGGKPITPPADRSLHASPVLQTSSLSARQLPPAVLSLFGQADRSLPVSAFRAETLNETELDLTLKGILARRASNRKLALIAHGSDRERVYRIGNRIAGAEITDIETRRVILQRNGVREALTLEIAKPRRGRTSPASRVTEGITMISDRERVVSRNLFDRQMQRLPELLNQAQTAPYWDNNGTEAGFRVVGIETGSIFEGLGLRKEDVIVAVNGVSVRNNKDALAAYQSFKAADVLQLGLLRDGREVTIDFSIQ